MDEDVVQHASDHHPFECVQGVHPRFVVGWRSDSPRHIDWPARLLLPDDSGLTLVGDADSSNNSGGDPSLADRRARNCKLAGPDGLGIVFDQARRGIQLGKLLLRETDYRASMAKDDGARTGGSLIETEDKTPVGRCH